MIIKRFNSISSKEFWEIVEWCQKNLYHGGHYEPEWYYEYPTFYFRNEKDYTLFALRWA